MRWYYDLSIQYADELSSVECFIQLVTRMMVSPCFHALDSLHVKPHKHHIDPSMRYFHKYVASYHPDDTQSFNDFCQTLRDEYDDETYIFEALFERPRYESILKNLDDETVMLSVAGQHAPLTDGDHLTTGVFYNPGIIAAFKTNPQNIQFLLEELLFFALDGAQHILQVQQAPEQKRSLTYHQNPGDFSGDLDRLYGVSHAATTLEALRFSATATGTNGMELGPGFLVSFQAGAYENMPRFYEHLHTLLK